MDEDETDDERADTLAAAADYAITLGFAGVAWLEAWRAGDPDALAELERWRAEPNNPYGKDKPTP